MPGSAVPAVWCQCSTSHPHRSAVLQRRRSRPRGSQRCRSSAPAGPRPPRPWWLQRVVGPSPSARPGSAGPRHRGSGSGRRPAPRVPQLARRRTPDQRRRHRRHRSAARSTTRPWCARRRDAAAAGLGQRPGCSYPACGRSVRRIGLGGWRPGCRRPPRSPVLRRQPARRPRRAAAPAGRAACPAPCLRDARRRVRRHRR